MMTNLVKLKRFFIFGLDKNGEVFAFNRVFDTVNVIVDSKPGILFVNGNYV